MNIPFFKMSGCGNDFIIIDNRTGTLAGTDVKQFVRAVCQRNISVGADGLILIEQPHRNHCDFSWRFFNADGSEAEMCGNGGRCAARYAVIKGIAAPQLSFETRAGIIHAEVANDRVKIELPTPTQLKLNMSLSVDEKPYCVHFINTGVPHLVIVADNLRDINVRDVGREIRFHQQFQPAGTNVNFVSVHTDSSIHIRTYERGVEDETLACGTGAVAAALITSALGSVSFPVNVTTKGGEALTVTAANPAPPFGKVFLQGQVRAVCEGELWEEGYKM